MIEFSRMTCVCAALLAVGVGAYSSATEPSVPPMPPLAAPSIPSLKPTEAIPTPSELSPAGVSRSYELKIQEIQRRIAERKDALSTSSDEGKSIAKDLAYAREQLSDRAGKILEVQTFDQQRAELLKEYAALESRFNRFRIHWTTHNKPVRRQDGSEVSQKATPLKGCPDCQNNFDRFLAGDPELTEEYRIQADQMLEELDRKRARLLPMSVHRASLVAKYIKQDPELAKMDADIKGLESRQASVWQSDEEFVKLNKTLEQLRADQLVALQGISTSGVRRASPRKRNRRRCSLALRGVVPPNNNSWLVS